MHDLRFKYESAERSEARPDKVWLILEKAGQNVNSEYVWFKNSDRPVCIRMKEVLEAKRRIYVEDRESSGLSGEELERWYPIPKYELKLVKHPQHHYVRTVR